MLRTRIRPRWLSRNVILAADAIFGLVLIALGVGGRLFGGAAAVAPSGLNQTPSFEIAAQFGGLHPPGQTTGFAVARDGSMAVADRGRQVVIHLNGSGKPQAEWGPNFGPGVDAKDLVGVAADGDGWAVLDRGALRILRLNAQGQAQPDRTIDLTRLETYGPNGLAGDGHDNLYMADTGRDRIVTFNASGVMAGSFGDAGTDLGKFKQPMAVAFAPDGSFFVADWENARRLGLWVSMDGAGRPDAAALLRDFKVGGLLDDRHTINHGNGDQRDGEPKEQIQRFSGEVLLLQDDIQRPLEGKGFEQVHRRFDHHQHDGTRDGWPVR